MMTNIYIEVIGLGFRLINHNCPSKTLHLNRPTWFGILDLAVENGWNPMGTAYPEWWLQPIDDLGWYGPNPGGYTGQLPGLVLLEDALNLADALEQALVTYEPGWQRFQDWGGISLQGAMLPEVQDSPSLGAMSCLVDFCRLGPFHIEPLQ